MRTRGKRHTKNLFVYLWMAWIGREKAPARPIAVDHKANTDREGSIVDRYRLSVPLVSTADGDTPAIYGSSTRR